jgi:hypothetical protein
VRSGYPAAARPSPPTVGNTVADGDTVRHANADARAVREPERDADRITDGKPDRVAGADRRPNANGQPEPDADPGTDGEPQPDADAYPVAVAAPDADAHSHPDANSHPDAHANTNADAHTDTDPHTNPDAYANPDAHADAGAADGQPAVAELHHARHATDVPGERSQLHGDVHPDGQWLRWDRALQSVQRTRSELDGHGDVGLERQLHYHCHRLVRTDRGRKHHRQLPLIGAAARR